MLIYSFYMFSKSSVHGQVAYWLMIVGGLNWGLVGIGMLVGLDLNVVGLVLGGVPYAEAVVYVLVGIAAVIGIFGCRCKTCSVDMPKM